MVHAIKRGLLISDFNELSVGMILDYVMKYDGLNQDNIEPEKQMKAAIQDDFNAF